MSSKRTHPIQRFVGPFSIAGAVARFVVATAVVVMLIAVPASAQEEPDDAQTPLLSDETPTLLAEKLQDSGVYVGPGRSDADAGPLEEAVLRAREEGLELVILVPDEPEPSASAFARRMQEKTEADAAIVFPPEDGALQAYAAEEYESNRTRALNRAQEQDDPSAAIEIYVDELQSDGSRNVPVFVLILVVAVLVLLYGAYGASSLLERERRKLNAASS